VSDLIPEELIELLESARTGKWHGRIELHLQEGEVQSITQVRTIRIRKKTTIAGVICPNPGCGKRMEPQDYSNLFVCVCGTKRTRNQLARPTGSGVRPVDFNPLR